MTSPAPAARAARHVDIVISGASFAGLAFARAMSSAVGGDISIALIDRAPPKTSATPDARAFALSAGSKRMLESLGVWSAIATEAQPVTTIEITDSSLDAGVRPILLRYDNHVADEHRSDERHSNERDGASAATEPAATEAPEPASFIVPASALERALSHSLASAPGVTVMAPAEIESFADTGSRIGLTLAGGETLTASLLVGAEGRRSASRDGVGIKTVGWRYGQTAIVTTIAHETPHNGRAIQHFLPAGPFAILPLTGNRSCLTWTEDADEARRILTLDDAGFLAEIDTRVAGRLGRMEIAGPRQSWPLEMHLARAYVAPRFALLGDAAHGVHPIAGQGVNLAFRDAAALSEVVVDSLRLGLDPGSMERLVRYERWRRFDSAASAAAFDGLNRLFSNDGMLIRAARDFGLGVVDRLPALKRRLVAEAAGLTGDLPRLFKSEPL